MWFVATLFSYLQFFLQIINNAAVNDLLVAFHITPFQVGILSSAFFYPFIAVQIPVGFLLQKYSVKKILSVSAFLCGLSTIVFAVCHNYYLAIFFRALSGIGAGFGFLGLLTITRLWFKPRYFSLMVGLSELIAMLMTAGSEKILIPVMQDYGWRNAFLIVGLLGVFIALLLIVFMQDKHKLSEAKGIKFWPQLKGVLQTPACWQAGIFGCGTFAVVTGFSALWGFEFLSAIYHKTAAEAATGISAVFVGLALGCPIIGILVAKFGKKLLVMGLAASIGLVATSVLIFPVYDYADIIVIMILFILGFVSGSYYLAYEVAKNSVSESFKSMALAFCSMFIMLGAILLQPTMGFVMQLFGYANQSIISSTVVTHAMQMGMLLLLFVQAMSLMMVLILRNKNERI